MNKQPSQRYDDIIHLPHHRSTTHPPMSLKDRAAQFAPFAALTGHAAAIKETGRITEEELHLSEDALEALNEKLSIIKAHIGEPERVTFTCFIPDEKKSGGAYVTISGVVRKLDLYAGNVFLTDGEVIPVRRIVDMQSALFMQDGIV